MSVCKLELIQDTIISVFSFLWINAHESVLSAFCPLDIFLLVKSVYQPAHRYDKKACFYRGIYKSWV